MRLRETGSVEIPASPGEVEALLLQQGAKRAGEHRLEAKRSTWVLQETREGTRVIHARTTPLLFAQPDDLKRSVQSDLFELRKHFER